MAQTPLSVRDCFQRMLPRLGHAVVSAAANGRELVELCREQKPDLIIADVRMPEMDGDDAVQEICRDAPTPFILISVSNKSARIPDGIGSIRWVCLTKPVKREDLAAAIEQVFSASGEQE